MPVLATHSVGVRALLGSLTVGWPMRLRTPGIKSVVPRNTDRTDFHRFQRHGWAFSRRTSHSWRGDVNKPSIGASSGEHRTKLHSAHSEGPASLHGLWGSKLLNNGLKAQWRRWCQQKGVCKYTHHRGDYGDRKTPWRDRAVGTLMAPPDRGCGALTSASPRGDVGGRRAASPKSGAHERRKALGRGGGRGQNERRSLERQLWRQTRNTSEPRHATAAKRHTTEPKAAKSGGTLCRERLGYPKAPRRPSAALAIVVAGG